jgi:hypothetical protein
MSGLSKCCGSKVLIRGRVTVAPAVDKLTVLCTGEVPSCVQKHGTGNLKLHRLCKCYGIKVLIRPGLSLL